MQLVANVIRGDRVESIHRAEAVVVDSAGNTIFATGNPDLQTYVRSSAKPFQAYPLVESGAAESFHLTPKELALCCASHNSEPEHLKTVRNVQERTGISEEMLLCGTHKPLDEETANDVLRNGLELTPNYNNCSGKHTGMLLACKHLSLSLENYGDPKHPLQVRIREYLENILERSPIHMGIDGCSVPTFFLTIREVASAFRRLASADDPLLATIYNAMTQEPYMVAGRNRFDTAIMEAAPGSIISKVGAEGVRALGIRRGDEIYGMALKILDGNKRASAPVALKIFEHLGWLDALSQKGLGEYISPKIANRAGLRVGQITVRIIQ
ncbi:MAG: asparaginase [Candidatus Marinimicrobia bacterium]|nr:asparaginase [Candidatus Neomarinimicrobiota bacterium]MCF7829081.1 asparaginase [Candidatus Neomarinimicrobiota bacterium]MCF7881520.1 asparaginase [Candidatus Neomarinimicrobiota bacterium]